MKKLILLLIVCFAFSGVAVAQKTQSKGPKYKNQKVWNNKHKANAPLVSASSAKKVQGPKAKNKKAFKNLAEKGAVQAVSPDTSRKGLKGPKAKNHKPYWRNKGKAPKTETNKKVDKNYIVKSN